MIVGWPATVDEFGSFCFLIPLPLSRTVHMLSRPQKVQQPQAMPVIQCVAMQSTLEGRESDFSLLLTPPRHLLT